MAERPTMQAKEEEWAEDTQRDKEKIGKVQAFCGVMSDCSEEDIFQYQSLKKRRIGDDDPAYELPSSSMSSQKIKKRKKKRKTSNGKLNPLQIENVEKNFVKAESTQGPESMEFCPMCQMPLNIAIGSPDLHVFKCVGDFEKSNFEGECRLGLKCDVTIRQHYQRFSHHLLSQLRAGLNADSPQSLSPEESKTGPKVMDSCESPTTVNIHSSSLATLEQDNLEIKEDEKPDTPLQDSDSELSGSPSVLTDLPKQCMKEHVVCSDPVYPASSGDNSPSSDTDVSVESSPRRRMARKTFPYSPRQFRPEKVVCLLDPSREVNSSEAPASHIEGVPSKLSKKISNSAETLDEMSHNLENGGDDSTRTVSARMSCADSSPLDPNSTVSFCQKLSAHQTSTPKSVKPRNVARKSVKGKKYQSIEDVRNSQKLASKEYFSSDQTSQDVKEKKHRQKLNFMENKDAETKGNTEKEKNKSDNSEGEVSDKDGENGRKVEKSSPQRTSSPNLFEFGCEEVDDNWDEIELLDHVSQKSEASDVENDEREPSSQGSSQCNKMTVQSQIDRYFISPKTSSQESIASSQKTLNTDSQSTASQGGNARTKSSWKDIFKFSQGTKFSSTEKVSQSNSTTTGSQGSSGSSVSAGGYLGQSDVGRRQGGGSMWSKNRKRECPFYKKMPGTTFAVDAFSYGDIPDITCYFLTHFHSDHYGGLTKKFTNPIYCSIITANLVKTKLYVPSEYVRPLAMEEEHVIEKVKVTFLDANHCPGSVLILFKLPNGVTYLHTGDFRAHQRMELYPQLQNLRIHKLYLDTTYCDPKYDFPKQESVVQFAVNTALRAVQENPKTLILCGTYTIGKEKVFKAISDALGCKICVESDKKRILSCYNDDQLKEKLVTDKKASRLHVVGMAKLNLKRLALYLEEFHSLYDNIVAFKPTGWTHSSKANSLADIKPSRWGRIQIYGIPYSEHSSYSEMKRFVQFIRASGPTQIIPTVNVGRPDQRAFMESHFKDWMSQGNTSSGMNGHGGSHTRLHGTHATPSNPSKTLETFFKKK